MSGYVPTVFENSLFDKTSPEPWNQLIALSRETINQSLKALYEVTKAKDPMSQPLCHIELKTRTGGATLVANLNPCQVIPNVDFHGPEDDAKGIPMLYFQWNFASGEMVLPAAYGGTATKKFDVRGWKVAFGTQVGEFVVCDCRNRYTDNRQRLNLSLPRTQGIRRSSIAWDSQLATSASKDSSSKSRVTMVSLFR